MRQKAFETISSLEEAGWVLLQLQPYGNRIPYSEKTSEAWYAVLMKDGMHLYLELEDESRIDLRDIIEECPKCGLPREKWSDDLGLADFCPDCEATPKWRKEIITAYLEWLTENGK